MFDYISLMSRVLQGSGILSTSLPQCERNGVDQGVHNVLIHTGLLKGVRVEYPFSFPVINMQSSPEFIPDNEQSTELFDSNRRLFSIVHQYDRLMSFQKALALKYVDWVNLADPEEEWKADPFCPLYERRLGVELFRGMCDMGAIRLPSPASCCEVCSSNRNVIKIIEGQTISRSCSGFTFSDGVCYMKACTRKEIDGAVARFKSAPQSFEFSAFGATCAYLRPS
jgi:hypothetical protein